MASGKCLLGSNDLPEALSTIINPLVCQIYVDTKIILMDDLWCLIDYFTILKKYELLMNIASLMHQRTLVIVIQMKHLCEKVSRFFCIRFSQAKIPERH